MSTDRTEVRLILRPLPDSRPWPIRLRQALKTLLRRDRLQCVRFEQLPAEEPATTATEDDR